MKTKKYLCISLTSALFATQANALYIQRGDRGQPSLRTTTGAASTPVRRMDEPVTNSTPTSSTPTLSCTKENNDGYLPLGFLYDLVDHPQDISLRRTNRDTAIIKIPKHISACLSLDFEFRNVGNDKIVAIKNNYNYSKEEVGVATDDEFQKMSADDKYVACLKSKDLLIQKSDGTLAFDGRKAESDGLVTYSAETEFDLAIADPSKSMRLFFASPKAREYQIQWGDQGVPESPTDWPCLETERFAKDDPYLYVSEEDKLTFSANQACETQDYETILRELSELKSSSAGNAQELIKILEVALEDAKEKRIASIYERMEEIENLFAPNREDAAAGKLTSLSETRAKKLGREYADLLEDVNEVLYNPAILEIDRLMTEIDGGVTEAREEAINERISLLNEQIGEFSKKDSRSLGKVYDGLKEYALTSEALKIEGYRLKSLNFSRVAPSSGRGKRALSIEQADKNIKSTLKRFDNETLRNWEDINLAKAGNASPIRDLQLQAQQNVKRMERDQAQFVQRELQQEQKACASNFIGGVRNPMECQRFRSGQQRRLRSFQARQQRQRQALQSAAQRASQLEMYYAEAQRQIASERQDDFGFYEDDPFGFYNDYGDSSSLYNIGGPQFNNNVMQMGMPQQQGMSPQGMGQPPMGNLQRPMMGY